jgi:DNA-binding transcriptional LysR family regulator
MESIRRQEVDFGIGPEIDAVTPFNFRCLLHDEIYALVPINHEATSKSGITLRQLARFPVLMLANATALRSSIDRALEKSNVTFAIKHEVTTHHTAIAMAAAGLGVAILPRIAMPDRGYGNLKAVPLVNPSLSRMISIITLRGQAWSPAAARLAEALERLIKPS